VPVGRHEGYLARELVDHLGGLSGNHDDVPRELGLSHYELGSTVPGETSRLRHDLVAMLLGEGVHDLETVQARRSVATNLE